FDELLAKYPKSKHAEVAALNRAQVLYLSKKYEPAAAAAQLFLKQYPESAQRPAALYFQSLSQKAQDRNDAAAATLTELQAKPADARKTLTAVVAEDPASAPAARYGLAQCDIADKKFDSARATLEELLALQPPPPNAAQVALDHAVCLTELGRHEQAAQEFA